MNGKTTKLLIPLLAVTAMTGCGGSPAPYQVGLTVSGRGSRVSGTVLYKAVEDQEPYESSGTIGSGEGCSIAAQSTGTKTTNLFADYSRTFKVVGNTVSGHPIIPGKPHFNKVGVSIIKDSVVEDDSIETFTTVNQPGATPDSYEETTTYNTAHVTTASYSGVAADEYVVQLTSLGDLWVDLADEDAELKLLLLTRNNPGKGDVWASLDGRTLYFFEGREAVELGDRTVKADKVQVWTTGNVDPTGGDIISQCLLVGSYSATSTLPDTGNQDNIGLVLLDAGCEGSFINVQEGTQWWYQNVLVKQDITTYEVAISDYGYEWYEDDGVTCVRQTSSLRDVQGAKLFVEYSVNTIQNTWKATSWEK